MLFIDVTDYQSKTFNNRVRLDVTVAVEGTGEAAIELQREDGVFRTFSNLRIPADEIRLVTLPAGNWKLTTIGGPCTVEIK